VASFPLREAVTLQSLVDRVEISTFAVGATWNEHGLTVLLNGTPIRPRDAYGLEVIAHSLSIGTSIQHSSRRRWRT
jgi:hypothetical protein